MQKMRDRRLVRSNWEIGNRGHLRLARFRFSRDFRQFTTLRAQDKVELDMRQVTGDVLSATPRSDLKAGEYAIISVFDQNERAIRAGFEFGVSR